MQLYSTNNKKHYVTLKEAVLNGMPHDGGLYMLQDLPRFTLKDFNSFAAMEFPEMAFRVVASILKYSVPKTVIKNIVFDAFDFDISLIRLDERVYALELFHGPTLAFKDFAARFMSRLMAYFVNDSNDELTILTATSGDTGSAVAHGFHNMAGIKVIILYPGGMVSDLQEKQLTTVGDNVTALEINGTFDDCQKLVKQAFVDPEFKGKLNLTSANSINIARLIPQTLYYFYAVSRLQSQTYSIVISVPCGNLGNLTAGLMAKKMGLQMDKFIASLNSNDALLQYMVSGIFEKKQTVKTISNAMDVGNPSNFKRISDLYQNDVQTIRKDILSYSFSDDETKRAIREVYLSKQYTMDPHGAVGYLGLSQFLKQQKNDFKGIFLETAHPGKFADIVEKCISAKVKIPERLAKCIQKQKLSKKMSTDYSEFKNYLLDRVIS